MNFKSVQAVRIVREQKATDWQAKTIYVPQKRPNVRQNDFAKIRNPFREAMRLTASSRWMPFRPPIETERFTNSFRHEKSFSQPLDWLVFGRQRIALKSNRRERKR